MLESRPAANLQVRMNGVFEREICYQDIIYDCQVNCWDPVHTGVICTTYAQATKHPCSI